MHPKSIKIKAWTPGCRFVYPQVSLDRPHGPQGAKWRHQACQMTGLGTKSEHVRLQKDNHGYKK